MIYLALGHIRIRTDELLGAPLHVVRDGEVRPHQEHQEPQHSQPTKMPRPQLSDDAENVFVRVFHYQLIINLQKQISQPIIVASINNNRQHGEKVHKLLVVPRDRVIDLESIDEDQIQ